MGPVDFSRRPFRRHGLQSRAVDRYSLAHCFFTAYPAEACEAHGRHFVQRRARINRPSRRRLRFVRMLVVHGRPLLWASSSLLVAVPASHTTNPSVLLSSDVFRCPARFDISGLFRVPVLPPRRTGLACGMRDGNNERKAHARRVDATVGVAFHSSSRPDLRARLSSFVLSFLPSFRSCRQRASLPRERGPLSIPPNLPVSLDRPSADVWVTTSALTATTLIYATGAGITATTGTRLSLQSLLIGEFGYTTSMAVVARLCGHGLCGFSSLPRPVH